MLFPQSEKLFSLSSQHSCKTPSRYEGQYINHLPEKFSLSNKQTVMIIPLFRRHSAVLDFICGKLFGSQGVVFFLFSYNCMYFIFRQEHHYGT